MAFIIIPLIGIFVVILIIWGVWVQDREEEQAKTASNKNSNKGLWVQNALEKQFNTDDVYIYTENSWIVRVKNDQNQHHYLVNNDGQILADTAMDGSIYAMYKCHKLFIAIDDNSTPRIHKWIPNKLYGAVNDKLEIIIPIVYNVLDALEDDFILATKDGFSGVFNPSNKLVVPVKYENILQDVKSKMLIGFYSGRYDVYNYEGEKIKTLYYDRLYLKSADNVVKSNGFIKPEDLSIINNSTKAKIFKKGGDEKDDKIIDAQLLNGKWGLLGVDYDEIIPPLYNLLYNGPNAILVMKGELNITPAELWPGMSAYYFASGGKWGVVDFKNNQIVSFLYDWVDFTSKESLFLVNHGGKMYYLKTGDRDGFWGVLGGNGAWSVIIMR